MISYLNLQHSKNYFFLDLLVIFVIHPKLNPQTNNKLKENKKLFDRLMEYSPDLSGIKYRLDWFCIAKIWNQSKDWTD